MFPTSDQAFWKVVIIENMTPWERKNNNRNTTKTLFCYPITRSQWQLRYCYLTLSWDCSCLLEEIGFIYWEINAPSFTLEERSRIYQEVLILKLQDSQANSSTEGTGRSLRNTRIPMGSNYVSIFSLLPGSPWAQCFRPIISMVGYMNEVHI